VSSTEILKRVETWREVLLAQHLADEMLRKLADEMRELAVWVSACQTRAREYDLAALEHRRSGNLDHESHCAANAMMNRELMTSRVEYLTEAFVKLVRGALHVDHIDRIPGLKPPVWGDHRLIKRLELLIETRWERGEG